MYIKINTIDIGNYNIGISKGQSSYKSMWFTMLFVIYIIPKEIFNMDMQYAILKIFYMSVLCFKFPINDPISEFNKKMWVSYTSVY